MKWRDATSRGKAYLVFGLAIPFVFWALFTALMAYDVDIPMGWIGIEMSASFFAVFGWALEENVFDERRGHGVVVGSVTAMFTTVLVWVILQIAGTVSILPTQYLLERVAG